MTRLALLALSVALLGAPGCGREPTKAPHDCSAPITNVVPLRWIALSDRARNESCPPAARIAAIGELALAGPQANLVLPTLKHLSERGSPESVRNEARRVRQLLLDGRTNDSALR